MKTTTHRREIMSLLLSTIDNSIINEKEMEFLLLTSFFHQNFLDPAQVFGYVNVDIGDIRVVTVSIQVK